MSSIRPWYFRMEDTLFGILIRHEQSLSLLNFILVVTPNWIPVFLTLRLWDNFILIHFISIGICIEGLIIKNLGISFGGNPSMAFRLLIPLSCEWVYLLLKPEELIFEQFRAIFLPWDNMEMLNHEFLVVFHAGLKYLVEEFPQVDLLPLYPQVHEFTGLFLEEGVEKPLLFQLVILPLLP